MKKVLIAVAIIVVSGLAALTVNGKENKAEKVKVSAETTEEVASADTTRNLATAD